MTPHKNKVKSSVLPEKTWKNTSVAVVLDFERLRANLNYTHEIATMWHICNLFCDREFRYQHNFLKVFLTVGGGAAQDYCDFSFFSVSGNLSHFLFVQTKKNVSAETGTVSAETKTVSAETRTVSAETKPFLQKRNRFCEPFLQKRNRFCRNGTVSAETEPFLQKRKLRFHIFE